MRGPIGGFGGYGGTTYLAENSKLKEIQSELRSKITNIKDCTYQKLDDYSSFISINEYKKTLLPYSVTQISFIIKKGKHQHWKSLFTFGLASLFIAVGPERDINMYFDSITGVQVNENQSKMRKQKQIQKQKQLKMIQKQKQLKKIQKEKELKRIEKEKQFKKIQKQKQLKRIQKQLENKNKIFTKIQQNPSKTNVLKSECKASLRQSLNSNIKSQLVKKMNDKIAEGQKYESEAEILLKIALKKQQTKKYIQAKKYYEKALQQFNLAKTTFNEITKTDKNFDQNSLKIITQKITQTTKKIQMIKDLVNVQNLEIYDTVSNVKTIQNQKKEVFSQQQVRMF